MEQPSLTSMPSSPRRSNSTQTCQVRLPPPSTCSERVEGRGLQHRRSLPPLFRQAPVHPSCLVALPRANGGTGLFFQVWILFGAAARGSKHKHGKPQSRTRARQLGHQKTGAAERDCESTASSTHKVLEFRPTLIAETNYQSSGSGCGVPQLRSRTKAAG